MNIPNSLTVGRLAMTVAGVCSLLIPALPYNMTIATVIFALACFTDWLDGYLARKWKQTSDFGALMDPLADKILVFSYFAYFLTEGIYPLWMFLLVLTRDIISDSMRAFVATKRVVIGATGPSKAKTALQMLSIFAALSAYCINELTPMGLRIEQRFLELSYVSMLCGLVLGILGLYIFIQKSVTLLSSNE